jgi:MFS family permease
MSDNQVFLSIIGGALSAVLGGLLIIPIRVIAHANDGGDDGWGLLWIVLMILAGIVGFVLTAKWLRTRENTP